MGDFYQSANSRGRQFIILVGTLFAFVECFILEVVLLQQQTLQNEKSWGVFASFVLFK